MSKRNKKDEILTLSEIADYLKVSEKTILRMLQAGEFPGVKVSNQWRFVREAVDDWLRARMQAEPTSSITDMVDAEGRAGRRYYGRPGVDGNQHERAEKQR